MDEYAAYAYMVMLLSLISISASIYEERNSKSKIKELSYYQT